MSITSRRTWVFRPLYVDDYLMQDRLYVELYDYIIDFLHDDHSALRACSLVCQSWLPASRSHLFYHLALDYGDPRRIFTAICSSPHIASYVNILSVQDSYRQGWIHGDIIFPLLLKKFIHLRELEFNLPVPGAKTLWSTTAFKDICDAMSSMSLQSFTLRQFTFNSPHDFLKIFDTFRQVHTLQLDSVDISIKAHLSVSPLEDLMNIFPTSTHNGLVRKQAEIKRLLLRSASLPIIIPILLHPRSPLSFSTTTTLTMNMTMDNYDSMIKFLGRFPSLESLDLDIEPFCELLTLIRPVFITHTDSVDYEALLGQADIIDFKLLSALKSLSLQLSILVARTDPILWLLPCLASAAPDNALEELSLTCVIDKPPLSLTIQAFDNILVGWRSLDELLTQPPFEHLRRFRLDFALDNPIGDDAPRQIADEFTKQLQGLSRKGVLEVDVCEVW